MGVIPKQSVGKGELDRQTAISTGIKTRNVEKLYSKSLKTFHVWNQKINVIIFYCVDQPCEDCSRQLVCIEHCFWVSGHKDEAMHQLLRQRNENALHALHSRFCQYSKYLLQQNYNTISFPYHSRFTSNPEHLLSVLNPKHANPNESAMSHSLALHHKTLKSALHPPMQDEAQFIGSSTNTVRKRRA